MIPNYQIDEIHLTSHNQNRPKTWTQALFYDIQHFWKVCPNNLMWAFIFIYLRDVVSRIYLTFGPNKQDKYRHKIWTQPLSYSYQYFKVRSYQFDVTSNFQQFKQCDLWDFLNLRTISTTPDKYWLKNLTHALSCNG